MKIIMTEDDLRLIQRVARTLRPATEAILGMAHDNCDAHAYAALLQDLDLADTILFIHSGGMVEVAL